MIYEYLEASEIEISEQLATGLLYEIITDTMNLARETSLKDFRAFSRLWLKANIPILNTIARPRLNNEELQYFVRAIKNRKTIQDMNFIWLENVNREDIIPRLADFGLHFGNQLWSVAGGIYEHKIIVSIRNISQEGDAGKLAISLFNEIGGRGGGHKSAAKAVVDLAKFRAEHNVTRIVELRSKLTHLFESKLLTYLD
ncbi:MAG: DHH family phosphoesterase [Nitrospinota bacterium]